MSTTLTRPARRPGPAPTHNRRLVTATLWSAAGFVVTLVAAGLLDPGYSHRSEGISALASTESEAAGVMIAGFGFLALVALTSGFALLGTLHSRAGRTAGVLVVAAGVLTAACGFVQQSCSTLQQSCLDRERAGAVSGAHTLHNLLALPLFACLVVAGFLLASALRREARSARLSRRVRIAAFAGAAAFVWFGSGAYGDNGGLVQRLLVLFAFGIPAAVAVRSARKRWPLTNGAVTR